MILTKVAFQVEWYQNSDENHVHAYPCAGLGYPHLPLELQHIKCLNVTVQAKQQETDSLRANYCL